MQNTSKAQIQTWEKKQDVLIASLRRQPLIVVLRPLKEDFCLENSSRPLLQKIRCLNSIGIKHIEIAWSAKGDWVSLINELKERFKDIFFGAASITNEVALNAFQNSGMFYAMTPIWQQTLQDKARQSNHILIPGVMTPSEIQCAISFGWKIVKIFPASTLGLKYIQQLKAPIENLPFIIAAGGINSKDINKWLNAGYNSITLGRTIKDSKGHDTFLNQWLLNWEKKNESKIISL